MNKFLFLSAFVIMLTSCSVHRMSVSQWEAMQEDYIKKADFTVDCLQESQEDISYPYYMRLSCDTLYSLMPYDVWSRYDLKYFRFDPDRHGKPVSSVCPISNYQVGQRKDGMVEILFDFITSLAKDKDGNFADANPDKEYPGSYFMQNAPQPKHYFEVKDYKVKCRLEVKRNRSVKAFFSVNDTVILGGMPGKLVVPKRLKKVNRRG